MGTRVMLPLLFMSLLCTGQVWAGPTIQSWLTSSGARVMYVHAPDLPMLDVRVVFDAGSARDGERPGISLLTNATLTDGAGDWDADQIAERMADIGAELSINSLRDMAYVSVRTLTEPEAMGMALETMSAVLTRPNFEQDDLERNRKAMQIALKRDLQNPGRVAKKAFYSALFGEHPYAIHSGGTAESLKRLTRQDVLDHYARYYVARNAVVAMVGALDRSEAERVAEQLTRDLQPGEHAPDLPPVKSLERATTQRIDFPSSQSHLLLGQPGLHRGDPDYFVLYVANHILGGGGLVSILGDEVREKRGLSYSVYSYFSPMRRNGPFIMGAQTKNARVEEALEVMTDTLRRFIDKGPTEQQLDAAKRNITGGFPLNIASNSDILGYLAMLGFYDMPLDYLETFVGNINSVTRDQIMETLRRRVDPDRLLTVVVGESAKEPGGS